MSLVTVNQGDTGIDFTDVLTADGIPVDLTTALSVHFVLHDFDGALVLDVAATITAPLTGHVQYISQIGDLDTDGNLRQTWVVDYGGGNTETYPSLGWNTVVVESDRAPIGPVTGACAPWISWEDVPCTVDLSALPGGADRWQDLIVASVTNTLYERSCRQFGLCEITARPVPCCQHRRSGGWWAGFWGSWGGSGVDYYRPYNFCACGHYPHLGLGVEPIAEVTEVEIDGVILDPSAYRVDEWAWLVRTDGNDWPTCNDLSVGDDAVGEFSVTWSYGLEVPPEGKLAAGLLACSWARKVLEDCAAVPSNAQTIAREGVVINLNPKPSEMTGIDIVDSWLSQFHCGGHIFDPGYQRSILRVGT